MKKESTKDEKKRAVIALTITIILAITGAYSATYWSMTFAYICFTLTLFSINYLEHFFYYPRPYSYLIPILIASILILIATLLLKKLGDAYINPAALAFLIIFEETMARLAKKILAKKGIKPEVEVRRNSYFIGI